MTTMKRAVMLIAIVVLGIACSLPAVVLPHPNPAWQAAPFVVMAIGLAVFLRFGRTDRRPSSR